MKIENSVKSSHELYIILNNDGTIYVNSNRDYHLYKTKEGLEKQKDKYIGKKVAIFKLAGIKDVKDIK